MAKEATILVRVEFYWVRARTASVEFYENTSVNNPPPESSTLQLLHYHPLNVSERQPAYASCFMMQTQLNHKVQVQLH